MRKREFAAATYVSITVLNQLYKALLDQNNKSLAGLVGMERKPCRQPVLSEEEETMVVRKLMFAASRGCAIGYEGLRYMICMVAADGRKGHRNGVTSDDAVRSFRPRHRELTFRAQESKEAAKRVVWGTYQAFL